MESINEVSCEILQPSLKQIKFDKKFAPIPVCEDDEYFANGIFHFNITQLLKFITDNKEQFPKELAEVKLLRLWSNANLDEKTIQLANLSLPILLAEISPGQYNVIDGNHRVEKAFREKIEYIPAYRVSAFQHLAFLTSIEGYKAYVDYWNFKIKNMER